jgi:hypothetical protein
MRIIDPKSHGEIVHLSAIEARLAIYGYVIEKKSEVD